MIDVVKFCKHHGNLTENDIKVWPYKNKILRRCKMCIKEKNARYQARKSQDSEWIKNRKEKDRIFWLENKDRITEKRKQPEKLAKRRQTYANNPEHFRLQCNNKQKIYRQELNDTYIRRILTENQGLKPTDIPQEMVDIKRILIKVKRLGRIFNDQD